MKKTIFTIALMMVAMMAEAKIYLYDVNKDGIVNIADVTILVNKILAIPIEGDEHFTYDINYDDATNVTDVTYLVNGILGILNPEEGLCPDDNHPHLIDLGLPSGTKWSCCNVGADSPEGYGGYYAWGETEEKDYYGEDNYNYCLEGLIYPNRFQKSISCTENDVAFMECNESCMPNVAQGRELFANCISELTTHNGVDGWMLIGTNHEAIFLPLAGRRMEYGGIFWDRIRGHYWLSSQELSEEVFAYSMFFNLRSGSVSGDEDYYGLCVRPVSIPELKLSTSTLFVGFDQTRTVQIMSGSGAYTIENNNTNAVIAELKNDNTIKLTARNYPNATITVTDVNLGQTATIDVTVVDNPHASKDALLLGVSEQEAVQILGGSSFIAKSNNEEVATATMEGNVCIVKSTGVGSATITVTETMSDQSLAIRVTGIITSILTCPNDNHPHLIDLGLPSGTRWSCCNVGAEAPEAFGGYYSWGETVVKENYDWSTYIHCKGKRDTCINLGEDIAGSEHDVAHVVWRSSWIMPSEEQFKELLTECDREWTSINGVNVLKLTGPSGGTISLPLAGYLWGSDVNEANEYADYWTSTADTSNSNYAISFGFYPPNDIRFDDGDLRYTGLSVRPVFQVSNQSEGNTANSQP